MEENYRKYQGKGLTEMRPYVPGEDLTGIIINHTDIIEEGGMIAKNPYYTDDKWYVSKQFFADNFELATSEKSLGNTTMNNPKVLETVIPGANYKVPTYKITNEGVEDGAGIEIVFCKGNKEDGNVLRQEGVFSETLIQTVKEYLETVNVGPMASRETSMVITKLDEALMWIDKRSNDRKLRGVQNTYKS